METVLSFAEAPKALEMIKSGRTREKICPRSEIEPNLYRRASSAGSAGEVRKATEP
jgi:hypothetical protein